jgi:hypothetical protein
MAERIAFHLYLVLPSSLPDRVQKSPFGFGVRMG